MTYQRNTFNSAIRKAFATAEPGLTKEAHTLHVLTTIAKNDEVAELLGTDTTRAFTAAVIYLRANGLLNPPETSKHKPPAHEPAAE